MLHYSHVTLPITCNTDIVTGAAEVVLGSCDHILGEEGSIVGLTAKTYDRLVEEVSTSFY